MLQTSDQCLCDSAAREGEREANPSLLAGYPETGVFTTAGKEETTDWAEKFPT